MLVYTAYTEYAYRDTLSGTYTYSCTITMDAPLYNVTLFIPVPVDRNGNSPMASEFSNRTMKGVPADWETTLFDTGKSTLLKIVTPAIIPPEGTAASRPYTITFSSETASRSPIDTLNPVEKSAMFRPVQALRENACQQEPAGGSSRCFTYSTAVYADYQTSAGTSVAVTSAVSGKNTWNIFGPHSNEYHTGIRTRIDGENHGWVVSGGILSSGTGTYDIPGA
ncbi:MAG: hypothetical protein LUQ35_10290 [Methanoregula sp.]|nr:hypothetical protein [Methanoregula sp.]